MEKTILFAAGQVSPKAGKWIFSIIGILNLLLGIRKLTMQGINFDSVFTFFLGVGFLFYGLVIFTSTSFTPKIVINETEIRVKKKFFGTTQLIEWMNVQSIRFGPYNIAFQLDDRNETIDYEATAETSMEIKSTIRESAEQKNIPLTDG